MRAAAAVMVVAAGVVFPSGASGQTTTQQTVAILPFGGSATGDRLADVEATVRGAVLARGARVPDRQSTAMAFGVSPPTNALSIARACAGLGATHALVGSVSPMAGQYNLQLTLYECPSGRSAEQHHNIGDHDAGRDVAAMLEAIFQPNGLGPAPVDPAEQQRLEAERLRQEEERRRSADRAAGALRAREIEEARRRREQRDRDNPVRAYDAGGPVAVGVSLGIGGRLSGGTARPAMVLTGTPPDAASGVAFALRAEAAYALTAVRGLELAGALQLMTSPTTAVGLGVGAQYSFPREGRLPLRGTAGVLLGLWQGTTGARATTQCWAGMARTAICSEGDSVTTPSPTPPPPTGRSGH